MTSSFENFCGGAFWTNESYRNEHKLPIFTECFQYTILIWIPALFFWLLAPIFLLQVFRTKLRNFESLPWSFIFCIKMSLSTFLILDAIFFLIKYFIDKSNGKNLPDVYVTFPIIWILTMLCILIFHFLCKFSGMVTSGIIHLTFILHAVCGAPKLYYLVQKLAEGSHDLDYGRCYAYFLWYLCILAQVIAQCFADPRIKDNIEDGSERKTKESDCSFLNRLTFWWYNSMPLLGAKSEIKVEDLFELSEGNSSSYLVPLWEKYWIPKVNNYNSRKRDLIRQLKTCENQTGITVENPQKLKKQLCELEPPSIVMGLYSMFKYELLNAMAIKFLSDTIQFVNPFILKELISFITDGDGDLYIGIAYTVGLFVASELRTLLFNYHNQLMFRLSTLKLSNIARKEKTIGEIVNLMAIDVERLQTVTVQIQLYWSAPYQCTLALIFLFLLLGYSALPGIAIMVVALPMNIISSRLVRRWNIQQMKLKDHRTKMFNEMLNGIKVIKFYAWELPMQSVIKRIRKQELRYILKSTYVRYSTDAFNWSTPFLVALVSFLTYTLSDEENHILTPQIAFVSLTVIDLLRQPMTQIGSLINQTIQAVVSNDRLKDFLVADELDHHTIERKFEASSKSIKVKNAYFSWEISSKDNENYEGLHKIGNLHDINLEIPNKNLVGVVGKVGSGKSSLLCALLGEMEKLNGQININGKIAYVPQQAWIQNMSLKENILFGKSYDKDLYEAVIDACALRPDLTILPQGDMTEIGEKGINLSGGQKARVSLARALYQDYDVYLLDDPLSAVDSHVGKHIFEKVIGPNGLLRNKTRILVTHGINFLKDMNLIVHIENGCVIDAGRYQRLLSDNEKFVKLIEQTETERKESISSQENRDFSSNYTQEISEESENTCENFTQQLTEDQENELIDENFDNNINQFDVESPKQLQDNQKLIQKEKVESGRVKMNVYLQYAKSATYIRSFIFIFMYIVYAVVQMLRSVWLSDWSNDEAEHEHGHTKISLAERLGVYAAYGFVESLSLVCSLSALIFGTLKASKNLHNPLLYNILRSPMSFFDTTPIGRILNRVVKDIDVCDTILSTNFRYTTMAIVSIISTLIIIMITSPIFAGIVIPLAAVYIYLLRFYIPTSRQLKRLESIHRSPIYSHFGETIQGASTIRAFDKTENFIEMCYKKVDEFILIRYMGICANRWLAVRLEFIGNSVVLFAALLGVISHENGWLQNAGLIALSVSYSLNITNSLNMFSRHLGDLETNIVAVERIKEYTDTPNEAPWHNNGSELPINWPNQGKVHLKNYATRYRPDLELVIKNITAVIEPSEKIGIVGRTGAGKSSLTLALFRMIEAAEGEIIIDNVEIGQLGLHDLRSNLTIIPQDPVLFSGTLRFNLDPFNKYSDDEIWIALELAHLKGLASSLPDGLDHVISEGGENLSFGQRQLVCLVRALLRRSKILILDEATASVDMATDTLIQETIRKEFQNSTVITIAHRLNTIMDYDRVMVLEKGEIKEFDTPSMLLSNPNSIFSNMVREAKITK